VVISCKPPVTNLILKVFNQRKASIIGRNFHYPINIKGFLESVFLRTNIIGKGFPGFSGLLCPAVSKKEEGF